MHRALPRAARKNVALLCVVGGGALVRTALTLVRLLASPKARRKLARVPDAAALANAHRIHLEPRRAWAAG